MTGDETYDAAREDALVRAYMTANGFEPARETAPAETTGPPVAERAPDGELEPGDAAKVDAYMRHHYPAG